jgi:regulator of sirC expression with transglutaminase-like and TPR domain
MAITCNQMILGMHPNSSDEIRDGGILEEKIGNYESSIKLLNKYLEMEPNSEDVDFILELIREMKEKINQ